MKDILFLYKVSDNKLKLEFLLIEILSIINGLLQGLSIVSIGPFILLLTNKKDALNNNLLNYFYNYFEFVQYQNFIYFYGFVVIFIIIVSNLFFLYSNLLLTKFGFNYGENLQRRLYKFYINQSLQDFIKLNSSEMIAKVYFQTYRISNTIVVPILDLFSKIFISIIIIGIMFYMINYLYLFFVILILITTYFIIYYFSKNTLFNTDKILTDLEKRKYKLLGDSLRGINVIKIFKKEKLFISDFNKLTYPVASNRAIQRIIASSPKFVVEMLVFVLFVLTMMLFVNSGQKIIELAPMASILFYSIYKLIPYVQGIFYNIVNIRGNLSSISDLKKELIKTNFEIFKEAKSQTLKKINKDNITIKNLNFYYNEKFKIKNLSFELLNSSMNFIFGKSGSGKSTIAKLLTGINDNYKGEIFYGEIERKKIDDYNFFSNVTYVDQNTFLFDDTILFNITFKNELSIDEKKSINKIIKICELEDIISKINDGLLSKIGENGVKISGGEKQRIGLARALIKEPKILILDEATNSLDFKTEKKIFNHLKTNIENCTYVIITHNISLLPFANKIINISKGIKTYEGNYENFKYQLNE